MVRSEKFMRGIFLFTACISILAVCVICFFLANSGGAAIKEIGFTDFVFGTKWHPLNNEFGILPMIVGSIYVSALAIAFGVPIGILCAIYLTFFCKPRIYKIIKPIVDLMAAVPSIVYGFFGLVVMVPIISSLSEDSNGKGVLTASLLLGIMILPTIVSVTESSLRQVPGSYYEGALALGASHELAVIKNVVPAAKSGIVAGVVLGVGRAIGEAMAVVLVAGNQTVMPDSILSGVRTLTTNVVIEMGYAQDLHRGALIATSLVLFVFILIINISFSLIKRKEVA